jgi:hypothetical protein
MGKRSRFMNSVFSSDLHAVRTEKAGRGNSLSSRTVRSETRAQRNRAIDRQIYCRYILKSGHKSAALVLNETEQRKAVIELHSCYRSSSCRDIASQGGEKSRLRGCRPKEVEEVTLRLTISQSVCLGIEHPCGTCDQILLPV